MQLVLDHLAVAGESRDAARAHIEEALGLPMVQGGAHALFGTHNHLMGLADGLYLEAISIDPDAPAPKRARWFDLDTFTGAPRLTNWICAAQEMGALPADVGKPVSITRGDLAWDMAVPETGKLPYDNMHPAIIRWSGDLHPASMLPTSGAKLLRVTVQHPEALSLKARLGAIGGASVQFETGPSALEAEFDTPHGRRVLR